MADFILAVQFVLKAEGGESDDPDDPGGFTRYGISQRAHPDLDVRHLTERAAIDAYRDRYWDRFRLDRLPQYLGIALLDATVQHGGRPAVRMLQHTVGTTMDGIIGPITLAAAYRMDPETCLNEYCARRGVYYGGLFTFGTFGLGWMRRLFSLHAYCLDYAVRAADTHAT